MIAVCILDSGLADEDDYGIDSVHNDDRMVWMRFRTEDPNQTTLQRNMKFGETSNFDDFCELVIRKTMAQGVDRRAMVESWDTMRENIRNLLEG